MAFSLSFSVNHCLNHRVSLHPPVTSKPSSLPQKSAFSYSSSFSKKDTPDQRKLKHAPRASPKGIDDLIDDSTFIPLTANEPVYGPPVLLLLGFELEELGKIRELLKELDGEFLRIIFCTEEMIPGSLWDALHTTQPNLEAVKIAKSLPRICFLSGLSGEEVMVFTDAFPETGLEPAVFAALVPNSANKPLKQLIEEVMGDHEMLTAKQPGPA